jgi:hypothetical protein
MTNDDGSRTPQEKRRAGTAVRLREALNRLVAAGAKLTVVELAREAGVGRNAIYVNHREIIAELCAASSQRDAKPEMARERSPETDWRAVAGELKQQVRALATENAVLLKRALDAEQASARAERRRTKLEEDFRALRGPISLPLGPME